MFTCPSFLYDIQIYGWSLDCIWVGDGHRRPLRLLLLGQVLDIRRTVFGKVRLVAGELPQELLDAKLPQLVYALLNCENNAQGISHFRTDFHGQQSPSWLLRCSVWYCGNSHKHTTRKAVRRKEIIPSTASCDVGCWPCRSIHMCNRSSAISSSTLLVLALLQKNMSQAWVAAPELTATT